MNNKSLFLAILLCSNIGCIKIKAQNTQISNIFDSLNSIIYTDETGKSMVGVQVGDIVWSPTNLSTYNNNKKESFFSYPKSNPCPNGWRLPTLDELKKLQKIINNGRGEFNYEAKGLNIRSDDNKNILFIPASGVMSSSGILRNNGQIGGFWSSKSSDTNTSYNLYFNGNSLSIGSSRIDSKMNIRCVCEM